MTMILDSQSSPSGLRNSAATEILDNIPARPKQLPERRPSRRQRPQRSNSIRGPAPVKRPSSSARWQASRMEEQVPPTVTAAACPPTRGVRRTTSMDAAAEPVKQRGLRPNKSCEGMPLPRRRGGGGGGLEGTSSGRRPCSINRRASISGAPLPGASLPDVSNGERRLCNNHNSNSNNNNNTDMPVLRPRQMLMDGSSDDGARGSRRRRGPMEDNSGRRRMLPGRTMSNSSGSVSGSVRRRVSHNPSGRRSRRQNSFRGHAFGGGDIIFAVEDDDDDEQGPASPGAVVRGKGLEDSSRRRKEPTLSKLSIEELRNRLVGEAESENQEFAVNWDNDLPPLVSDLNIIESESS